MLEVVTVVVTVPDAVLGPPPVFNGVSEGFVFEVLFRLASNIAVSTSSLVSVACIVVVTFGKAGIVVEATSGFVAAAYRRFCFFAFLSVTTTPLAFGVITSVDEEEGFLEDIVPFRSFFSTGFVAVVFFFLSVTTAEAPLSALLDVEGVSICVCVFAGCSASFFF